MSVAYETYLALDKSKYEGEYVGICNDVIVHHSRSFKEVYERTKSFCGEGTPFVTLVPTSECLLM